MWSLKMVDIFWSTFAAALLASIVTSLGVLVINRFDEWGKKNIIYFISFASGVLISVTFTHIIPKSFNMNDSAPYFLLAGFFTLYLINSFIHIFICDRSRHKKCSFGIIPAIGIGFHSFIDGIIYSITFKVSIFTGILAAIGMILHEFPEGIVTFLMLAKSGYSKKKSTIYSFLSAAVSTPLGMLVSWPFIDNLNPSLLGILLSLSAGALVYVGATHLLPETNKAKKKFSLFALFAGIIVALIIVFSK